MDPVTAATGAVKAATDVAETSVGKALLLRTATAIGDYWGESAELWVAKKKERRKSNLDHHIQAVRAITHESPITSEEPIDELGEWAAGAAEVSPDDEALSRVWQAALIELQRGGSERRRILRIAQKLEPDEAAVFVNIFITRRKWSETYRLAINVMNDSAYTNRFREMGIVQPFSQRIIRTIPLLLVFAISLYLQSGVLDNFDLGSGARSLGLIGLGGISLCVTAALIFVVTVPALTSDGEALRLRLEKLANL